MNCLREEELLLLLDGGIAPNQVEGIQAHLSRCSLCRGRMAELQTFAADLARTEAYDEEAHVRGIMSRLDEPRLVPQGPRDRGVRRWRRAMAGLGAGLSALAIAAGVALFVRGRRDVPVDDGSFVARGSMGGSSLGRDVGVRLFTGESQLSQLTSEAAVVPGAAYAAAYTNIHPRPVYLLLFAVDAGDAVHWLYPAYESAAEDPPSIALERTDRERPLPTSVVLEAPAKGALRFVAMATESPLHVSDIERRAAAELGAEALRRAFPGASISELRVRVVDERSP